MNQRFYRNNKVGFVFLSLAVFFISGCDLSFKTNTNVFERQSGDRVYFKFTNLRAEGGNIGNAIQVKPATDCNLIYGSNASLNYNTGNCSYSSESEGQCQNLYLGDIVDFEKTFEGICTLCNFKAIVSCRNPSTRSVYDTKYSEFVHAIYHDSSQSKNTNSSNPSTPEAPSNLLASSFSESSVDLSWDDNSDNETGFVVETSSDGGSTFTTTTTLAANSTDYTVSDLASSTAYHFRVKAINSSVSSSYTDVANATTQSGAPGEPGSLQIFVLNSSQINLTWTDSSMNETSFAIERSVGDNTNFVQIGTSAADNGTYFDTTVSAATTYYYRVRALRTGYPSSGYSSEVNGTTP